MLVIRDASRCSDRFEWLARSIGRTAARYPVKHALLTVPAKRALVDLQNLRRAFQYHWRLWTIPELQEMLTEAGFSRVHVWLRPMQVRRVTHGFSITPAKAHSPGCAASSPQRHSLHDKRCHVLPLCSCVCQVLSVHWIQVGLGASLAE